MKKSLIIIVLLTSTLLSADIYSRANDIVTDHDTGLQWQDQPNTDADNDAYNSETTESNRARQWIHAKAYCDSLNLDGGGWRLPAITELDAIVDPLAIHVLVSLEEDIHLPLVSPQHSPKLLQGSLILESMSVWVDRLMDENEYMISASGAEIPIEPEDLLIAHSVPVARDIGVQDDEVCVSVVKGVEELPKV